MSDGFSIEGMHKALRVGQVLWQRHALQRMLERGMARADVIAVLVEGERIEDYPDDRPWPSALFLGRPNGRPLHVVAAFDEQSDTVGIITAYEPNLERFEEDHRTRRGR